MAKTLKTGDVKKYIRSSRNLWISDIDRWASVTSEREAAGFISRASARIDARSLRSCGIQARIAKIIKRTPKYVFVEVSK